MKKSLIAMSIAAVAAAPMAANAAGTVYAQVQAEMSNSDAGLQMIDNARGRIGYKGSEELGNGMTMIGKVEFKLDTADGDSSGSIALTKRELMVGMKAGWGTVMLGRLKSPYKYLGGVKYDPFVTTTLQSRGVTSSAGAFGHHSFLSDNVGLRLMGGKLQVNLGLGDVDGNDGDYVIGYKHSMGKKDEIVVAAAHDDSASYDAAKIGGSFGPVKFQVESTDANGTADTFAFVSYGMKMGSGKLIIQGGTETGDTHADDVVDVTLGYIQKFTKSSRWFAGVRSTTGSVVADAGDRDDTITTVGMRFDY